MWYAVCIAPLFYVDGDDGGGVGTDGDGGGHGYHVWDSDRDMKVTMIMYGNCWSYGRWPVLDGNDIIIYNHFIVIYVEPFVRD